MTMCGKKHPKLAAHFCDKSEDNHEWCSGFDPYDMDSSYVDWANPDYVRPLRTEDAAVDKDLKRIAAGVRARRS